MWPHFWAPCIFWVPALNWVMAMTHLALPPVLGCLQAEMLLNLLWDPHLSWSPAGLGQSPGCQSLPWHRALPASPPAWAFWVLGEDWDRPFPSGLKMRSGHWSRSGPHIYYQSVLGRFLNIGGRWWGHSKKPLPGTAEEKWLEQKHWTLAAEALKWRVGRGWGRNERGHFIPLPKDPEAKTLVSTLSSDLSAPHTGSLHCATDVGPPAQLQQLLLGSSPWFSGAFNLIRDGKAVPSHCQWVSGINFR